LWGAALFSWFAAPLFSPLFWVFPSPKKAGFRRLKGFFPPPVSPRRAPIRLIEVENLKEKGFGETPGNSRDGKWKN